MTRVCGAKTKAGTPCQRPAGWGTPVPGGLRCKLHGGSSPSGQRAARREVAVRFARGTLGDEVAASPFDAMDQAVRLTVGLVAYYRHELADAAEASRLPGQDGEDARARVAELTGPFTDAIRLEKDVAAAAITGKVEERRQALAKRQAELVAAAMGEGLSEAFGELVTPERHARFVRVTVARLRLLEAPTDAGPLSDGS